MLGLFGTPVFSRQGSYIIVVVFWAVVVVVVAVFSHHFSTEVKLKQQEIN